MVPAHILRHIFVCVVPINFKSFKTCYQNTKPNFYRGNVGKKFEDFKRECGDKKKFKIETYNFTKKLASSDPFLKFLTNFNLYPYLDLSFKKEALKIKS
ncbi:hypothetical protein BpHYR1_007264 [Brachionus plicatilis]|uniref:Uncharacterized protein n=1 Tax=Brachionus plicatilis TaxID=10195 RepID=A0A3M7T717_BRAPC|nr:hypothetical protein BpHYR1_007264 [Brachionus plicatilis]